MLFSEDKSLLTWVVSITESRDIEILERIMLKTAYELIPCERVYFFRTDPVDMSIQSSSAYGGEGYVYSCDNEVFEYIEDLRESMMLSYSDYSITSVDNSLHPIIISPVNIMSSSVGFITLDFPEASSESLCVLEGIVRMYQNYISALLDRDRDELTGLFSRKLFEEKVNTFIRINKRLKDKPLKGNERRTYAENDLYWLGIIDIDNFKSADDNFGHIAAEKLIVIMGKIIQDFFRASDMKFRFDEDDFAVVIKTSDAQRALVVFERLRKTVENYNFPFIERMTVSIGISMINMEESSSFFIMRALRALHYAKSHGKNKVFIYEDLVDRGELPREAIIKKDQIKE